MENTIRRGETMASCERRGFGRSERLASERERIEEVESATGEVLYFSLVFNAWGDQETGRDIGAGSVSSAGRQILSFFFFFSIRVRSDLIRPIKMNGSD